MERGENNLFCWIYFLRELKFLPGILEAECRESELYTATCRHGGNTVLTFISPVHRSAVFLFRCFSSLSEERLLSLDQVSKSDGLTL